MNRKNLSTLALGTTLLFGASAFASSTANESPDLGANEQAPPTTSTCTADYDNNGTVNFGDFMHVMSNWGQPVVGSTAGERIGFAQLLQVLAELGNECG